MVVRAMKKVKQVTVIKLTWDGEEAAKSGQGRLLWGGEILSQLQNVFKEPIIGSSGRKEFLAEGAVGLKTLKGMSFAGWLYTMSEGAIGRIWVGRGGQGP